MTNEMILFLILLSVIAIAGKLLYVEVRLSRVTKALGEDIANDKELVNIIEKQSTLRMEYDKYLEDLAMKNYSNTFIFALMNLRLMCDNSAIIHSLIEYMNLGELNEERMTEITKCYRQHTIDSIENINNFIEDILDTKNLNKKELDMRAKMLEKFIIQYPEKELSEMKALYSQKLKDLKDLKDLLSEEDQKIEEAFENLMQDIKHDVNIKNGEEGE